MKKLLILCVIIISNITYSQIRKAGDFYELKDLWKKDSVVVKQLLNKYDVNISKLDTVQFFEQFDLNLELHEKYSYNCYVYVLYKKTGLVTMNWVTDKKNLPKPNKYVLYYCFDDYTDKKIINVVIF